MGVLSGSAAVDRARAAPPSAWRAADPVPLVVDLDGTLLRSDSLVEALFATARNHPLRLLQVPLWLAQGRAMLKRRLATQASFDVHTLPYQGELLEHLRQQKQLGRRLVLASGTDESIARAVADELGLFDDVLASDGTVNLTAERKRDRLIAEFGEHGFDYVGNSARDLPVWAAARRALLVTPSSHLAQAVRGVADVERVFEQDRPRVAWYLGAMRLHHWLKNLLLLVPLLAAQSLYEPHMLARALVGGMSFCLAASGIYLLNDLLDLSLDRRHPSKKERALASGRVPIAHALVMLPALWLGAVALGLSLSRPFAALLGFYVVLMLAYSIRLKDIAIVDCGVLALGYTLRILAGSLAAGVGVSAWLLVCSVALFFGLALLKRYAELVTLRAHLGSGVRVRAYRVSDASLIAGLGAASGCVAVAVLALYPVVEQMDHARGAVWIVCALLLFWTGHMWLMAHRGRIPDDPVTFALHDRASQLVGAGVAAVLMVSM